MAKYHRRVLSTKKASIHACMGVYVSLWMVIHARVRCLSTVLVTAVACMNLPRYQTRRWLTCLCDRVCMQISVPSYSLFRSRTVCSGHRSWLPDRLTSSLLLLHTCPGCYLTQYMECGTLVWLVRKVLWIWTYMILTECLACCCVKSQVAQDPVRKRQIPSVNELIV